MPIHFVSGKPGGGKSLYGLKLIAEELVLGSRPILTNVPLRLEELNAYLARTYPGRVVDIGRVWVLGDEQTAEFWTYRPGVRIPRLTAQQWLAGELPSYAGVKDGGLVYVIDEIHNYFGSRQWAQTGRDVLFYLSQHRKLGDTVVCITQAIGNVDKQFRSVTQDFTFVRNLSKERYGLFRLPAIFVRKTFSSPPTEVSVPMETGTFTLDVRGLAACYDHDVGIGIHGRGGDIAERKRGLHSAWAVVGLVVIAFCLFAVVPKLVARVFSPRDIIAAVHVPAAGAARNTGVSVSNVAASPVAAVQPAVSASGSASVTRPVVWVPGLPPSGVESNRVNVKATNVVVNAILPLGPGAWVVGLSDGRTFEFPRDRRVQYVSREICLIEGLPYRVGQ